MRLDEINHFRWQPPAVKPEKVIKDLGLGAHITYLNGEYVGVDGEVGGDLLLVKQGISTFKGSPKRINGNLYLKGNFLESFEDCPEEVKVDVDLSNNRFTSLQNIHKYFKKIGRTIHLSGCPIKSHVLGLLLIKGLQRVHHAPKRNWVMIINRHLPSKGIESVYDCQEEMLNRIRWKDVLDLRELAKV